jgi:F-type H+-transporting ATPase subunit alpha
VEILKQGQYVPMPIELQVLSIFAVTGGFVDKLEVTQLREFEEALHRHMLTAHTDVMDELRKKLELDKDMTEKLKKTITPFVDQFLAGATASLAGATNGKVSHGKEKSAQQHANAA